LTGFRRSVYSLIRQCHRRLNGVFIENLDFETCIKKYDRKHTLFYCDPPYLHTSGYKYSFTIDDHKRLAELLKNIKGKFLLSINDHPEIRKMYKGMTIKELTVKYSISLDKRPSASRRKELLVANYPLPRKFP